MPKFMSSQPFLRAPLTREQMNQIAQAAQTTVHMVSRRCKCHVIRLHPSNWKESALLATGSGEETERIAATSVVEAAAATERGVASADG
jgi:hypothetical protein